MTLLTSFIQLLSGLAIFVVGLLQMAGGLEKLSSNKVQQGLAKVSNNRFTSFGFGALITTIMQSSSVVSIMAIAFLNANLLTLAQGIAIVFGANVGTSATAILSSFATINISAFFSLTILIGVVINMLGKKARKSQKLSPILIGFGFVFIGLNMASDSFKTAEMAVFMSNMFESISFPLLLILFSIGITIVVQSSSLTIGIAILLVSNQVIPLEYALFIVLGAKVGTTFSGIFASIGSNKNAKRLALINFLFNLFSCIVFSIITWVFTEEIVNSLSFIAIEFQVAAFQVIVSLLSAIISLLFIKQFEQLSLLLIKSKDTLINDMTLLYLNETLLKTPSFAMTALKKEVDRMFELSKNMMFKAFEDIEAMKANNFDLIKKDEDIVDFLNESIALYLVRLSGEKLVYQDELEIGKVYHIINDLERLADHAYNFTTLIKELNEKDMHFSEFAKDELNTVCNKLKDMFNLSYIIYTHKNENQLKNLHNIEDLIDDFKIEFEQKHVTRLKTGECLLEHSQYYFDFTSQLERVGDHLINIGYSTLKMFFQLKIL
ncbi:MAG: Na/Pi cotransporter family protein [Acholeplasmataceae bacterium]